MNENGKVYTWGYNRYGQLGNGTTENSTTPICISNQEENMLKNKKISDIITNYDGMIIVLDQDGKIYMRSAYDYITDIGEGRKMYNNYRRMDKKPQKTKRIWFHRFLRWNMF